MIAKKYEVYDPGVGYRLLSIGETFQPGDEVHPCDDGWGPISNSLCGGRVHKPNHPRGCPFGYYRRKIDK